MMDDAGTETISFLVKGRAQYRCKRNEQIKCRVKLYNKLLNCIIKIKCIIKYAFVVVVVVEQKSLLL